MPRGSCLEATHLANPYCVSTRPCTEHWGRFQRSRRCSSFSYSLAVQTDCSKGCNGGNSNNNINNNSHYSLSASSMLGTVPGVSHSMRQHGILAQHDGFVIDFMALQNFRHLLLEGVTNDPSLPFTEDGK